jgi:hypothetical protein
MRILTKILTSALMGAGLSLMAVAVLSGVYHAITGADPIQAASLYAFCYFSGMLHFGIGRIWAEHIRQEERIQERAIG